MFTKRTLQKTIQVASQSFPVLLLTGARQVGKTTLLEACAEPTRRYVTLDDPEQAALARTDPALFFQRHPPPVIVDEIQYAPELFRAIKLLVDKVKQPGMFWLTGSQKFHLMQGITESLAGRVAVLDLLGLSQAEISGKMVIAGNAGSRCDVRRNPRKLAAGGNPQKLVAQRTNASGVFLPRQRTT